MRINKEEVVAFVLTITPLAILSVLLLGFLVYDKRHMANVRKNCTLIYTTKYVEKDRRYKSTTYDFVQGHDVYSCLDSIPYGYSIYKN